MPKKLDPFVLLVAGGALLLRAVSLVGRPLWFDEIFTVWVARQPLLRIVEHLKVDSGPPLQYALATPLVRLGEGFHFDAAARILSFLALAVLFAALPPRLSGGRRFPVLLAASPLLFFYSTEARPYGLVAALAFVLFLATFRARDGWKSRLVVLIAAGILPWIHYLGALVVLGSSILCSARRKWTRLLLHAAGASVFLLWLPIALRQPALSMAWNRETAGSSFPRLFGAFGFWGDLPPYFTSWRTPAAWIGAVLGLGLLAAAAAASAKKRAIQDALVFALLPLALALLASRTRPIYFPGRTEVATLPVALWAFARASRRTRVASVFTALASIAGAFVIAESLARPLPAPPYSVTAKFVAATAGAKDLVIASDADYLPLRLEKDRGTLRADLLGVPSALEIHPGWFEPGERIEIARETSRVEKSVASRKGARVFLAIPPDPTARSLVIPTIGTRSARVIRLVGGDSILVIEPGSPAQGN